MGHHEDHDHVEDAVIEESTEAKAPVLAVLSNLSPNNLEDRVRNAAREMAKNIYESKAENVDNLNQIVVATAASIAANKTEGMVFLYIIAQEIAALDKTGEIASLFLQKGIIKKIYNLFGNSIDDSYRNGVVVMQVLNSKAYLIDAFLTDFFPLYANGELAGSQGMTSELLYQDKFLNIFFRAVKSCYENDKVMGGEVLRHQAILTVDGKPEDQSQVQAIIDKVFERETSRVLSLFQQSDKIKIQTFLEGKIDELLKLAGKNKGDPQNDQEVSAALGEIRQKLDEFLRHGGHENAPSEVIQLLQKIDRNVVSIYERQVLLAKRIEEMAEPSDDFLSDIFPKDGANKPEEFNREDVLAEIRTLSGTVEKMFSSLKELESKNQTVANAFSSDELPADHPSLIFGGSAAKEEVPTLPEVIHKECMQPFDMDQLSTLIEAIVVKTIAPITKEFIEVKNQLEDLKNKVVEAGNISIETNKMLKDEISNTNDFIAKLERE